MPDAFLHFNHSTWILLTIFMHLLINTKIWTIYSWNGRKITFSMRSDRGRRRWGGCVHGERRRQLYGISSKEVAGRNIIEGGEQLEVRGETSTTKTRKECCQRRQWYMVTSSKECHGHNRARPPTMKTKNECRRRNVTKNARSNKIEWERSNERDGQAAGFI